MRDSEKVYSKEELLNYLYKYGNIPVILFAKDKEGKYVYASENPEKINWIDAGEENSILGKKDDHGGTRETSANRTIMVAITISGSGRTFMYLD